MSTQLKPETSLVNAVPPVTFAAFYGADLGCMLQYLGGLAWAARDSLAWDILLAQPGAPTTITAARAFLLVRHLSREITDHVTQPARIFSPLAALGASVNKVVFGPIKKRLDVDGYLRQDATDMASRVDHCEDPFDPETRERNRLSVMLIIYMILGRRRLLTVPEQVAALLAQLPPLSAATHADWWDAANEILKQCEAALAALNLHSYCAAVVSHPCGPGSEFRFRQKPSFRKMIAIFSNEPYLCALASGTPGGVGSNYPVPAAA